MTASASNFTFLSMPSLLPGMYFLNTAAKPQSSFKTHSSSNVKCKQWSENSSPDGLLGLQTSSSLSLSLHPHASSHLKLGWWVYYHPSAIPIFGRRRTAGVMETITILNPQNSHEAALGSWEKFPSASSLPLQVSSPHWDQNLSPLSAKGKLRNWKCKAHLGCTTKKCYQREDFFSFKEMQCKSKFQRISLSVASGWQMEAFLCADKYMWTQAIRSLFIINATVDGVVHLGDIHYL